MLLLYLHMAAGMKTRNSSAVEVPALHCGFHAFAFLNCGFIQNLTGHAQSLAQYHCASSVVLFVSLLL